jgi:predicted NUDIX family NTP pyrophosphohydrolase
LSLQEVPEKVGIVVTPVIPALGRLKQEGGEFEISLGYIMSSRSIWKGGE